MIPRRRCKIAQLDREAITEPQYMSDTKEERTQPAPPGESNTVSSFIEAPWNERELDNGLHAPVLDLDFPAFVLPSSTPGHCHLYLERPLEWSDYNRLLEVMAEIGLLEEGYVHASQERRATYVREPECLKPKSALRQTAELERRGAMAGLPVPERPIEVADKVEMF